MAEENELKVEEEGSGGKSKLIIIIVAVVVVLLGGAIGAFLFLGGDDAPPPAASAETAAVAPTVTHKAMYVGMPRPFVFNIIGDDRDRLVQIKVQLLVRGDDNEAYAKQHIPLIEGSLLSIFSAASVEQLSTQIGKDKLREDSLIETQKALKELTGNVVVEKILFTGFVMQ